MGSYRLGSPTVRVHFLADNLVMTEIPIVIEVDERRLRVLLEALSTKKERSGVVGLLMERNGSDGCFVEDTAALDDLLGQVEDELEKTKKNREMKKSVDFPI